MILWNDSFHLHRYWMSRASFEPAKLCSTCKQKISITEFIKIKSYSLLREKYKIEYLDFKLFLIIKRKMLFSQTNIKSILEEWIYSRQQNTLSTWCSSCQKISYLMQFYEINIVKSWSLCFILFITSMRWKQLAIKPEKNRKYHHKCSNNFAAYSKFHYYNYYKKRK